MTNKLVVIINSLKYKLQLPPEPLTRWLPPPDPRSLCPQLNVLNPPRKKFVGTPLAAWKLCVDEWYSFIVCCKNRTGIPHLKSLSKRIWRERELLHSSKWKRSQLQKCLIDDDGAMVDWKGCFTRDRRRSWVDQESAVSFQCSKTGCRAYSVHEVSWERRTISDWPKFRWS
jgi:hypothetical protein